MNSNPRNTLGGNAREKNPLEVENYFFLVILVLFRRFTLLFYASGSFFKSPIVSPITSGKKLLAFLRKFRKNGRPESASHLKMLIKNSLIEISIKFQLAYFL